MIPDTPDTCGSVIGNMTQRRKRGVIVLDSDSDESDIHTNSNTSSPWMSKNAAMNGHQNGIQRFKAR